MRQFCKNIRSRSKSGQKTNEIIEAVFSRLLYEGLKVQASIRPSGISGLGLFAGEAIPQGSTVFSWNDQIDQEYSKNYPDGLPPEVKKDFMDLASTDGEGWFLAGDGGAYFNHSTSPNVVVRRGEGNPSKWDRIAARDIDLGEEMTMDYGEIGDDVPE